MNEPMKPGDTIIHKGQKLIAQEGPTGSGSGCGPCELASDMSCVYDCFPGAVKMILRKPGDPWEPVVDEPEKDKQLMLF
ncbi:MAG: hypothetical protein GY841_02870 [FCB group bacterium]|nr:hypothetical protein [FCB group bacterium]